MHIGQKCKLEIEGRQYTVVVQSIEDDQAVVLVDDREMSVNIETDMPAPPRPRAPKAATPTRPAPPVAQKTPAAAGSLLANMPGVVLKLLVEPAQDVKAGEVVLILEAMKMENEIRATRDGQVSAVHVQTGQRVQTGDPLISWS